MGQGGTSCLCAPRANVGYLHVPPPTAAVEGQTRRKIMTVADVPVADVPGEPAVLDLGPEAPRLAAWPDGTVRLGSSRVLLELVIHAFQDGDTPEGIVQRYPSAALADVYAAIAYYLTHRPAVDAYLAAYAAGAAAVRQRIGAERRDLSDVRRRIQAARAAARQG